MTLKEIFFKETESNVLAALFISLWVGILFFIAALPLIIPLQ